MADIATLTQRLADLRELRAQGVRKTRFGEDEVEYRSDTELRQAIADIEYQIAILQAAPRTFVARTHKGF